MLRNGSFIVDFLSLRDFFFRGEIFFFNYKLSDVNYSDNPVENTREHGEGR
jgi:hypothetical protein